MKFTVHSLVLWLGFALLAPLCAADLSVSRIDSIADVRSAAISAYRKQEPQLAANLYRQSIAMGDSSIVPFYNLACCYGRMGKIDSCRMALQGALDRGYPDYMELGTDADLQPLQQQPYWAEMWQQAFRNSYGKVMAKQFDAMAKEAMLANDTARLRFLLPFERRTDAQVRALHGALTDAAVLFRFSNISNAAALTETGSLVKRKMDYTDNHFVVSDEFVFELPIPYFDADFAPIIAKDTLHMRMRTFDHLYSYLDTLFMTSSQMAFANKVELPVLTDSVMALKLVSKGEQIDDYQEKVALNGKLCQKVLKMVQNAAPITADEFMKLQPASGDICFVRLNSLPVRKQFKGLKLAFYKGANVAVVVCDGRYCLLKGKFSL